MQVADFKGKRKSVLEILAPHGLAAGRVLIAGLGDLKTLTVRDWMDIGGAVRGKLHAKVREADAVFLDFNLWWRKRRLPSAWASHYAATLSGSTNPKLLPGTGRMKARRKAAPQCRGCKRFLAVGRGA